MTPPEAASPAPERELPEDDPEVGQLVHVRSRRWLVEDVEAGEKPGHSSVVSLACAEDDAQGEEIQVFWDHEIDRRILKQEGWGELAAKGFDTPRRFAAFLHTLRWNCVTATDPNLMRRERGFGVNPWRTHSRFLVSHNLLRDATYADLMREWLGPVLPGSLLILDEAHHAAPASGGRYGIESKFTRAVRDLSGRFEHRLFLSATPHNGHSNSFSTLLELLDPNRFTRGVKVRRSSLEAVMVRRLKEDIRNVQGGFPRRRVVPVRIDHLPEDAPELLLSRLLDEYREAREERFKAAPKSARAASGLLVIGLQQRLLSSIEAFARSLKTHRGTLERRRRKAADAAGRSGGPDQSERFASGSWLAGDGGDEDRAAFTDQEAEREEEAQIRDLNASAESARAAERAEGDPLKRENDLLDRMQRIAEQARGRPDAKARELVDWIREHLCPGLPPLGHARPAGAPPPRWNDRRLLVFTENREGTKRYLRAMLDAAIASTDRAEERIVTIDGLTRGPRRREIQRRFNTDPQEEPLRILLATDAAREGLNFQAHCTDLFHFDLPWNPGRIEQRNGRIDRKLQQAPEVRCHYFVLPQRAEDRVLQVLVRKTETIKTELGSLSQVIDDAVERRLTKSGIRHRDAGRLAREIERADIDAERRRLVNEELEAARERRDDLKGQIARCRDLLQRSRHWVQFEENAFRDALSCSLEIAGAAPLQRTRSEDGGDVWTFPVLDGQTNADPSWAGTLDSLRRPRRRNQKLTEWRKEVPPRPVVFEDPGILTDDTVHLHLEQRVAQRLLARFRSQGFVHHDLSRACLAQSADSIPRVVLLGRLTLYGWRAERLHEEYRDGRGPMGRTGAPRRPARRLRARRGDPRPRPAGAVARTHRRTPGERCRSPPTARLGAARCRRTPAPARSPRPRDGGNGDRSAARARRAREPGTQGNPGTPAQPRRQGAGAARIDAQAADPGLQPSRRTTTPGRHELLAPLPGPVRPRSGPRAPPRARLLRGPRRAAGRATWHRLPLARDELISPGSSPLRSLP